MASQDYPPGFGDEGVQGSGGAGWWEGNELDGGDGGSGPGPGNMNGGTDMGNGNNGKNGNGPPPRPQNSNSPLSTTNPPATTSSYNSAMPTNTISTSTAAASSTSSSLPVPSASYISSTSIDINTTSTVDPSSSASASFSSSFSTPTPTITTSSSNSSTFLEPTTSISFTSTTTSSSTIVATPVSNTGAGTQSVGVTVLPSASSTQQGLSKGSIAGIIIGPLALLALILTAIWYFLRRKKKTKQHRKSIGGFGIGEWYGSGTGGTMSQVNEPPSCNGKVTAGMGFHFPNPLYYLDSISIFTSKPVYRSTSALFISFPFSPTQQPKTPDHPTSNRTTKEEGPHEDIVDFGDSIDWIRNRDRMRDRERGGLTASNMGSGLGEGKPDWRYSVRVNGGGNNL
ncbi:uncharacterized protein EAF01_007809 [Botrytis porri]|uniref:uncharacterized protein n=1 Tax=Botrytis porri TaxID=87229 RepID=UPI0018FF291A|nr:uncharacterized protein EAF01_007809 [Botrytis porri]KAF7900507.1 hypothetical protein EAF01_007809 [Botrytis porri]